MKNILILILATVFIVSCASNGGNNNRMKNAEISHRSKVVLADNTSDEKVICKQIRKTGSHRTTTVCQAQSELDATRKATQNEIIRFQHQTGAKSTETGGL